MGFRRYVLVGVFTGIYVRKLSNLIIKTSNRYHDRFLLLDDEAYHLGASLKDLGKKVFGFSKMDRGLLKV